jgi:hypothetical protein
MSHRDRILDQLEAQAEWGYLAGSPPATEPTALVALAATAQGRDDLAARALTQLVAWQAADGSLGVLEGEAAPAWPTSLALLAWTSAGRAEKPSDSTATLQAAQKATAWLLKTRGKTAPPNDLVTHDSTLTGWPWAEGTHSWVEPTALAVLALKAAMHHDHPRTREAVDLLFDRILPTGGCNYGNTFVLQQQLRAHLQPTGLALLALAGEEDREGKLAASLGYLEATLDSDTALPSLCYGLLGLIAHGVSSARAESWLQAAGERLPASDCGAYPLVLWSLAALGPDSPLVAVTRGLESNP